MTKPSIRDIQRAVCTVFNVRMGALCGRRRLWRFSHPRMAAMEIACLHGYTTTQIGRSFNRDHSTVCHAKTRVRELRARQYRPGKSAKRTSARRTFPLRYLCAKWLAVKIAKQRKRMASRMIARLTGAGLKLTKGFER